MDTTRIDRITLKLSGMTEAEGRSLGVLIARGLGDADLAPIGAAQLDHVLVKAVRSKGDDLPGLSRRVVAEILAQLRRNT